MPVVIFQAWVTSGISRQNTRDELGLIEYFFG